MDRMISPHSCVACQARLIFSLGRQSEKGWYEYVNENYYTAGQAYVFNISYEQAITQATRGCEFFMWLVTLRRASTWYGSFLRAYFLDTSHEQLVLDWVNEVEDDIDGGTKDPPLIICAEEWDKAATEVTHRPPNTSPSSSSSMRTVKGWLRTCIDSHIDCPKPKDNAVPSSSTTLEGPCRLIEISGDILNPTLRLVETKISQWRQYVALSYCWGRDQKVKLFQSNLTRFSKDIPHSTLHQTIRDAIRAAMEFDMQYIWIDALCIIQDSDEDKGREISRMGHIYENAYFTLSAARAVNVDTGFLQSRYIPGERGYRMPFLCQDGQLGSVIFWKKRESGVWDPIHKRAWCLQESILSPRVVEFGTHSTRWHCSHSRRSSKPELDGWILASDVFSRHVSPHPFYNIDWSGLQDPIKFYETWISLVTHYTSRGIGHQGDKLVAISAIARKMSSIGNCQYMAGLWRENLLSMLWCTNDGRQAYTSKTPGENSFERIKSYTAPSWSWASIDCPVEFLHNSSFEPLLDCLQLIDVDIAVQIPSDEFSAVKSARLSIDTLTMTLKFRIQDSICSLWHEELQEEFDGLLMLDLGEKFEQDVRNQDEVLFAWLTGREGLILKKREDGRSFSRIGIFSQQYLSFKPTAERVKARLDII